MVRTLLRFVLSLILSMLVIPVILLGEETRSRNSAEFSLEHLPLIFESNQGQADAKVRFLSRTGSYAIYLEDDRVVLVSPAKRASHDPVRKTASLITLELKNANQDVKAEGLDLLPGKSNYFIGRERKKWVSGIEQYGKVRFRSVYPGIDVVYYGGQEGLEYDFLLSAGADSQQLKFRVQGADKIELMDSGDLSLRMGEGTVTLHEPVIYQEENGERHKISGRFVVSANNEVGLAIGNYDHSRSLVVDPVLSYSTLIGGDNSTQIQGVAVDSAGNVVITGTTFATSYPVVNAFQGTNNGDTDAFVTKLNAAGNTILFSTYLGGSSFDNGGPVAVDKHGNLYVTGSASSSDFPTTPGAFMTSCGSFCNRPYVAKFDPTGKLVYSTFMGGSNSGGGAIAVDDEGEAYVTGTTASDDVVTTPGSFEPVYLGILCTSCYNAYIQKLNASGTGLVYGTYFGSAGNGFPPSTTGKGIAIDASGAAYLVGTSSSIPLKNAIEPSSVGNAYFAKLSPDGSSLVYSSYFGGGGDAATGVAIDVFGNLHIIGTSASCQFPLSLNAWSTDCAVGQYTQKIFVTTLNSSGSQALFSTFLGSGFSGGIAVDARGNTYVTGIATSNDFPLLNAIQYNSGAGVAPPYSSNSFVTELNPSGKILFSTYLGQTGGGAQAAGIAVDGSGAIYLAGAGQGDFPLLHPIPSQIFQSTYYTLFVAKISSANVPQLSLSPRVSPILALRNVSSVPLTISSITASANFTRGGDCGKMLAPGTGCTLLLIGKGDNKTTGTVTIASNASSTPQTFTIHKSPTGDSVGASLSISPMYVQFPPQLIGSTSAPRQVVITNSGPLPVAVNSIFLIQPAAFSQINDCPGLLEPFSYCTITITYTAATGNDSAQLGILHDPYQSRDTVFLSGFGSNSAILASTQSVNFGAQFVGTASLARIVNFTNTSTYPASITGLTTSKGFAQVNTCTAPLAPQAKCRVGVRYTPQTNESPTGQLTAQNFGPGGPQVVSLYGTGQILSDLAAAPVNIYATVGQATSGTATLTNSSANAMSISSFSVTGPFTQGNDCHGSLAAGASCTLTVNFNPTKAGTFNGKVAIAHTGVGSPQVVPVSATARTIFDLNPSTVDYGQVQVNTPMLGYLGLANNGNASVTIESITVQGADFKLTKNGCPSVLPPFWGCADVEITFTPTATGLRTGTATVKVSDSATPFIATLQGLGVSAGVGALSQSSLTFSPQSVGTVSAPQTLTLTNTGAGSLALGTVSVSTHFMQSNNCPATLAAGASCILSVSFAPTLQGILEGTLTLQDDGTGSPHTVVLGGIGQ